MIQTKDTAARTWFMALAVGLVLAVQGCGGGEEFAPNVIGQRLDVARSTAEDSGFEVEAIGGGTFGIVDESNWTVCETQPAAGAPASGELKMIVERTCEGGDAAPTDTAPSEEEVAVEQDASTGSVIDDAEPSAEAERARVPSVVGKNHQAAQDRLQASGFYNLLEEDATGEGRALLWDRNWVVVRQSPAAGKTVAIDRAITLYSKKLGE